jgi:hypothetical protein
MESIQSLEQIELKVRRLMSLYQALQDENEALQQELFAAKEVAMKQREKIDELQKKVEMVKLASSLSTNKENVLDLREKISEFVAEMDRVTALFTKQ